MAVINRRPCGECKAAFIPDCWDTKEEIEFKKTGPPCSTCKPVVHPTNNEALAVFRLCRGQVITAPMGEILGINILAVKEIMNLYDIKNQRDCLERVMLLSEETMRLAKCD